MGPMWADDIGAAGRVLGAALCGAALSVVAPGCSLVLSFDDPAAGDPGTRDASVGGFADVAVADAMVDAAPPPPDACTDTAWMPVLAEGDFDGSNVSWTDSGRFGGAILSNPSAYAAHSEPNLAYFVWGTPEFEEQAIAQTISLPATTSGLRFSGWRCFISETPGTASASVEVNVRLPDGTLVATLETYSNTQGSSICNWSQLPTVEAGAELGDLGGGDIVLALEAMSPNGDSVFLFDSLALEARVCAP